MTKQESYSHWARRVVDGAPTSEQEEALRLARDVPDVEWLAAHFHAIYQHEAKRQGDVRHKDRYDDLPENIKEFDRVLARYVLAEWNKLARALLALAADLEAAEAEAELKRIETHHANAKRAAAERERDEARAEFDVDTETLKRLERERDEANGVVALYQKRLGEAKDDLAAAREALKFYGESSDTGLLNDRGERARAALPLAEHPFTWTFASYEDMQAAMQAKRDLATARRERDAARINERHRHELLTACTERRFAAERKLASAREALRDAPMPVRESTLKGDDWHERYDEWWHANASEAALRSLDGEGT